MKKSVITIILVFVCFLVTSLVITAININASYKLSPNPTQAQTGLRDPININTATVQEFMLLPGIGESLANSIIAHREANGPFQSPSDIFDVKGIGQVTYDNIIEYITVGGQS